MYMYDILASTRAFLLLEEAVFCKRNIHLAFKPFTLWKFFYNIFETILPLSGVLPRVYMCNYNEFITLGANLDAGIVSITSIVITWPHCLCTLSASAFMHWAILTSARFLYRNFFMETCFCSSLIKLFFQFLRRATHAHVVDVSS